MPFVDVCDRSEQAVFDDGDCIVWQVGGEMSNVKGCGVSMRMRDYIEPLFVIAAVQVCCSSSQTPASPDAAPQPNGKQQSGKEAHHPTEHYPSETCSHQAAKDESSKSQLPANWLSRGCFIMSEERLPYAAKSLMVPVLQELHAQAPGVLLMRSPAPSKIWAHLDVLLQEPQLSHGPSLGPAINILSMVVAGLSPPSSQAQGEQPPPVMSWDKARMMMHGKVRVHMNKACLRLLAGTSPYSNAEFFQLLGQPVTISYQTSDTPNHALHASTPNRGASAQPIKVGPCARMVVVA